SDAARGRLVRLIPSVIGLTGDDLHIDARIALACARMALPVVAAARQQVLAVSVLGGGRVLGGPDGGAGGRRGGPGPGALEDVPHAAQWARGFTRDLPITRKAFRRRSAPFTVHTAAEGIAQACVPEPDEMLHGLLITAIGECAASVTRAVGAHGDQGRGCV